MPRILPLSALGAALILFAACDSEGSSLFDPNAPRNSAPVIASVSPDGVVLAGVDVVTITGQNFSATPGDNIVVFDDAQGNSATGIVLSASATSLDVRTPNLPNANLRVRVAVVGAPDYSNAVNFPLTPAFVSFGGIGQTEAPFGIASDPDGTVYMSLENEGSAVGVIRVSPEGVRSDYFTSTFPWPGLVRVDGRLIGVRRVRAVFELPEGGSQRVVAAYQPSSVSLVAVAGGADGTIYSGGNSSIVYVEQADGGQSQVTLPAPVRALEAAGSFLYAATASTQDDPDRIYAFPVSSDGSLGTPSRLTDLPEEGTAIAVAADGTLLVGLNRTEDPIVLVDPSGTVAPLYPNVIPGPVSGLAYGAAGQLYMVRGEGGDESPDVLRIETRRDGAR